MYIVKLGNEREPGSYHPISLLPTLGKVLDKCTTTLVLYLEAIDLLNVRQYVFRKNVNLVDALRNVLEYLAKSKKVEEGRIHMFSHVKH